MPLRILAIAIVWSIQTYGADVVTVGINLQKLNLDPVSALNFQDYTVIDLIHEPLVYVDEELRLVGALADRWELLEHGMKYRIHLRYGGRFSDNSEVKADDVVATFKRHLAENSESNLKEPFSSVLADGAKSVRKINDNTVEFDLKGPYPSFLELLAFVYILPSHYDPRHPVGAGPYKVKSLEEASLEVQRQSHSTSSDIKNFKFVLVQTNEFEDALKRGQIDITLQAPLRLALSPPPGFEVFQSDYDLVSVFFYYNLREARWRDRDARLFLKSLVLKARNQADFLSKFDRPLDHLMHEGILTADYYAPVASTATNKPKNFPKSITVLAPNTFLTDRALEILKNVFQKEGIELKLTLGKGQQLRDPLAKGEFDLALFPYESSLRDPDGFLFLFDPDGPLIRHFSLPTRELFSKLKKLKFGQDQHARLFGYAQVFREMEEMEVLIPYFTQKMPFLYCSRLLAPKGHSLTPLSLRYFRSKP
jgi:ABC-type transport system substrate-binding protein